MFKPPHWLWMQQGDVGWWVQEPWRQMLLGPEGLRLEEWRDQGRLTTIKAGPHRIVYKVQLADGMIYVKHNLVPDYRAMFRQWFRRGKGRNEGKRSRELASIGVPTIVPIALGEQRKRGFLFENYLVTWEIPGSVSLDEFVEQHLSEWPEPRRSRVRRRLAVSLGVLTARLHDAGFFHIDFHPGNILVRVTPGDMPELFMIDLDALRKTRRLPWAKARGNLAMLNHYFWLRSNRADRHRFLKSYLENRSRPVPEARWFAQGIERSTRAWAERLWRRWGKRCRFTNKYFQLRKQRPCWCVAVRDLEPGMVPLLLADPDAPFACPDTKLIKNSRTSTVAETTMVVAGEPSRVVFKRFNRKKWLDPVLTLVRPSRAWRSWQAGQHLASRGIPTPRNLAFLARTGCSWANPLSWFLPRQTYLITMKQDNVITLAEYLRKMPPVGDPAEAAARTRKFNMGLARLIRALHERSLSHRDLKASNILVHLDRLDSDNFLSLIDLVGVRLQYPVPLRRRIQNLARLSVSLTQAPGRTRTETLRFLRAYLPWGLSPLSNWKAVWRSTEKAIQAKRARNRRRGRPLS